MLDLQRVGEGPPDPLGHLRGTVRIDDDGPHEGLCVGGQRRRLDLLERPLDREHGRHTGAGMSSGSTAEPCTCRRTELFGAVSEKEKATGEPL